MVNDRVRLLTKMFNPGEGVSLSPSQYGYMAIPLEDALKSSISMTKNNGEKDKTYGAQAMALVALNPIQGKREDASVTHFRSFLVELDYGPLGEQLEYVKGMKMPYTACVFSGGKSLHFLITLTKDLPDIEHYRFYANWILKIMSKADQNTKNPSRSIRIPDHMRDSGKQILVEMRDRVTQESLNAWLSDYEDLKPKISYESRGPASATPVAWAGFPFWVKRALEGDIDFSIGRNKRWFSIGFEFGKLGWSEEDTFNMLSLQFTPERDFDEREWKICVNSGWKSGRA